MGSIAHMLAKYMPPMYSAISAWAGRYLAVCRLARTAGGATGWRGTRGIGGREWPGPADQECPLKRTRLEGVLGGWSNGVAAQARVQERRRPLESEPLTKIITKEYGYRRYLKGTTRHKSKRH